MSGRLQGKIALISGTACGQGAAAKARFEAEGATVVGGDILTDGGTPHLDVTDEDSVAGWVQRAVAAHGRVDILYNNAGAVRFGPIEEQSFADWRFTLAAELDSIFLACKHAWPHPKASRGAILNIGSTAGLTGSMTNQRVAHTASKGGAIPLGRLGTAEDVIPAAVFLCSDEAAYITGANLVVDGGWSVVLPGAQQMDTTQ